MKTALVALALAALLLALFAITQALDIPLLSDERPSLGRAGIGAAALGVALLVSDVVLPVPSSAVMLAHGSLFGAVLGGLLSLAGSLGAAACGWWLGRRGTAWLDRVIAPAERSRGAEIVADYGALAIVMSRPVPVLAETVSVMAGALEMSLPRLLGFALIGSLPPAAGYAIAGAAANRGGVALPIIATLAATSSLIWLAGRWRRRAVAPPPPKRAS